MWGIWCTVLSPYSSSPPPPSPSFPPPSSSRSQGSVTVGIKSRTHVVLVALKRSSSELSSYQKKIYPVDDHVAVSIAGLTSDGRMLRLEQGRREGVSLSLSLSLSPPFPPSSFSHKFRFFPLLPPPSLPPSLPPSRSFFSQILSTFHLPPSPSPPASSCVLSASARGSPSTCPSPYPDWYQPLEAVSCNLPPVTFAICVFLFALLLRCQSLYHQFVHLSLPLCLSVHLPLAFIFLSSLLP